MTIERLRYAALILVLAACPVTAQDPSVADVRARAAQGDLDAQVALGGRYESGDGVPIDLAQALAWYRRAADKGHAGAQLNLAMMYMEGHGVPRDARAAITWYQKAAENGDAVAAFSLGSIYEAGASRVPRDETMAARWYRLSAETGLETAQYCLGVLYRDGRGVRQSDDEAIAWLRKAADQGDADAQIEVGILLSRRLSDLAEAHAWFNLAASRWKNEARRIQAAALRDDLEKLMTPAQRAAAYRRATEWQDAHSWRAIPRRQTPSP